MKRGRITIIFELLSIQCLEAPNSRIIFHRSSVTFLGPDSITCRSSNKLTNHPLRFLQRMLQRVVHDHTVEAEGVGEFVLGFGDTGFE